MPAMPRRRHRCRHAGIGARTIETTTTSTIPRAAALRTQPPIAFLQAGLRQRAVRRLDHRHRSPARSAARASRAPILHVSTDSVPMMRIDGEMKPVPGYDVLKRRARAAHADADRAAAQPRGVREARTTPILPTSYRARRAFAPTCSSICAAWARSCASFPARSSRPTT